MADTKVSDLTAITEPTANDLLYIVDEGSTSRKITWANVESNISITVSQVSDFGTYPNVSSGSGAPGSTPGAVGDMYIDTTADTIYVATATASSADWDILAVGSHGVADGDYGDITVSSTGSVWTIDSGAVTYSKIQDTSGTNVLLGRSTAGAGTVEEITCTAAGRALLDDAAASNQRTTLGLAIGSDVQAYDADTLKADTADVLTAGFATTAHSSGTKSSGTYTPDEADGNIQYATNGGAHTLAPMTNNGTTIVHYTNNGSAGAITTSGFTLVDGDAFTTTNTEEFLCYLTKANDVSVLTVKALQ